VNNYLPAIDSVSDPVQKLQQQLELAESQLSILREQVMQTQRLATIGTIAAVIAHEFNNLLTPVISYSQVALVSAQSDSPDMELVKKALTKSFAGATKAGKVCASMLGLARGESEQSIVDVQSLIDETLLVLARDPQKDGIALRVQVQPGLKVEGDAVQLEQVLLNLLINARQAMLGRVTGAAGSITIKALGTDDGHVRINITDTGPGIAENNMVKIFEPFFTTKGTTQNGEPRGTGLGLAICRQIIDHHRGRIEVSSEVGRGTTFTLVLPKCA